MRHTLGACLNIRLFFFNDTATTEIYTLSLHDALPICFGAPMAVALLLVCDWTTTPAFIRKASCTPWLDRKSTRLNSSHGYISYAVFCLKKKKKNQQTAELKRITYQKQRLLLSFVETAK